jgi:uroporphyrinogen decarboxylase
VEGVDVDAVGLDWMIDRSFARNEIQRRRPVQGNLAPKP